MFGLKRGIVKLVPFQSSWKNEFEKEKIFLQKILKIEIDIEHVGSTAVDTLLAKPIIDIVIGLTPNIIQELIYKTLSENGYEDRGADELKGERLFVKGTEFIRTHHLHIIEKDSAIWNNYILFRDYLKQNKSAREKYTKLKQDLAKKFPNNREAYTNGKSEFIQNILLKTNKII